MEDNAEGLILPTFSGRISEDWELHETNLKAWLFVRGIPLHSEESARILSLSLKDSAAIAYQNKVGELAPERTRFDLAVAWSRQLWNDPVRRGFNKNSGLNELYSRRFRQKGKRSENMNALIDDLERLFHRLGVNLDATKRSHLVNSVYEFPDLFARLRSTQSYHGAVDAALRWESSTIQQQRLIVDQQMKILDHRRQTHQSAPPNPVNPVNSSVPLQDPTANPRFSCGSQQAAQPGAPAAVPSSNVANSQPTTAPLSSRTTSPSESSERYDSEEGDQEEEEEEEEVLLDNTFFNAVAEDEETRNVQQQVSTGSTSLPFAAPTPCPHIGPSNLSRVDTLSPTHSTPIHHHINRPIHSRPALPSFDSPNQPSFVHSHPHLRSISHQRSQSIDSHPHPNRVSTPSFVAQATQPLFASQPTRTSFDHYQPARPSTSQSLYSRAPLPPSSSSPFQRSRSVLRKPSHSHSHSQHTRSFSQPLSFNTTSSPTISRSASLFNNLFRRKPKLDQSCQGISRPSLCLTPDSTEYNETSNWSSSGQVGGGGGSEGEVSFDRNFVGGEGQEESLEIMRDSQGRAPKQRGNGLNGLPP